MREPKVHQVRAPSLLDALVPLVALGVLYGVTGFKIEKIDPAPAKESA